MVGGGVALDAELLDSALEAGAGAGAGEDATGSFPLCASFCDASAAWVSWGLGVARLVDWLARRTLAADGALAQLAVDGRAEPSVLPMRVSESMLPWRAMGWEEIE